MIIASLIGAIWVVFVLQCALIPRIKNYGVRPRQFPVGVVGIFTTYFIHDDLGHLVANTVPFVFYGSLIILVAGARALLVCLLVAWLVGGVFTLALGRPGNHIGVSDSVCAFQLFVVCVWAGPVLWRVAIAVAGFFWYAGMELINHVLAFRRAHPAQGWRGFSLQGLVLSPISWEAHCGGYLSAAFAATFFLQLKAGLDQPLRILTDFFAQPLLTSILEITMTVMVAVMIACLLDQDTPDG